MGWIKKWFGEIPLDYERGYIDGFTSGLKFYKDSIDRMHKAVLDSEKVKQLMIKHAREGRDEE